MIHLSSLKRDLKLPCGATLPNRVAKSAMSENMADGNNRPDGPLHRLYDTWGRGGLGLVVTGNIMIDSRQLGEPRNMVLEDGTPQASYRALTAMATAHGSPLWAQLNHPGRQSPRGCTQEPVAPSAVELELPGNMFAPPRALQEREIHDIIFRFGESARLAKECGFSGVQIHGAHGYLVSQFLSPLVNKRTDPWGGTLENRMRFVLEVYRSIRRAVGLEFPVGLKLNSADFQRGGFSEGDSIQVIRALEKEGLDLLEISGGTYERAAMQGKVQKTSSQQREAYFLDFAQKVRDAAKVPLMLTGGFRSATAMAEAVHSGAIDVAGLARPIAVEPDLAARMLAGLTEKSRARPVRLGVDMLDGAGFMEVGYYQIQIKRIGQGKRPDPDLNAWLALGELMLFNSGFVFQRLLKAMG